MKHKIQKHFIKVLPLLLMLLSMTLFSQQAKKATGGSGQFKDRIWWLDFKGLSLASGGSQTRSFNVGSATVTVVIDQITFSGRRYDGGSLTQLRLEGYNSSFSFGPTYNNEGDGLDQMYNIGGTENNNQLYYALTNNINGDGNDPHYGGSGIITNFRMRAYVDGLNTPLSMIFASAETDNYFQGNPSFPVEYTQSTTNGSAWQLLEKKVQSYGSYSTERLSFSNSNLTARMSMGGASNPGNVALLYTTKISASSSAPLVVNTQMLCGGKSAVAIGLILDQDGGDAPSSFGSAVHSFQPVLTGGNPTSSTHYLSNNPVLASGTLTVPKTLYLGNTPPDNDASIYTSANCDADDNTGTDDEDAFTTNPVVMSACQNSYFITVPVHNLTNAPAYLRGWIDFNGNGTFQTSESVSVSVPNGATSGTLTWTGVTPFTTTGYRVMRLRISNDNLTASEYSTTVLSGEVEDHRIQFQIPQTPTVTSTLSNTCPATSVNLNNAQTGTTPNGADLVWYTNSSHTGTPLNTAEAANATAGIYYAFYYSSAGGCYSLASNAVVVTIKTCEPTCLVANLKPSIQNLTNVCPSVTVNLNNAHTGTTPSGANLVWFINNTHTGVPLSNAEVANATAGTYYAFYYNSAVGCYSLASNAVVITIKSCEPTCLVENLRPSVQNLTNVCPSVTVNLNNAHTGTTPNGANLVWFINNTHTGVPLSNAEVANATAGTYYAFYYNSAVGCYSLASNAVVVTIEVCNPSSDADLTIGIRANPATISIGGTSNVTYTFSNIGTSVTNGSTISYFIYKIQAGTLTIGTLNQSGWTVSETATGYFITSNKIVQPGLGNALIMNASYTHNGSNENASYNVNAMVINGSGGETNFSNNKTTTLLRIN